MSRLKPINDFIFKKIFGQTKNADLLKDLLESILTDIKIHKVQINKDVSLERKMITDKLQLHYIQLPKFREKCKRISSKLEEWLTFIENENLEEIKMINNKYVKKAEEELEYLTQ